MSENINNILISCSISTGLYIIYKTINHYRLRSSCNSNNELVISVVDTNNEKNEKNVNPKDIAIEIKENIILPEIIPTKPS